MIFWDTSAVVPLLLKEPLSIAVEAIAKGDPALMVFWSTLVECQSAIARREREGVLTHRDASAARARLLMARDAWTEIQPSEQVREQAGRLLLRHPLRAADSLQLAAALVWTSAHPRGHRFVCFDQRLVTAARAEGFDVIDA